VTAFNAPAGYLREEAIRSSWVRSTYRLRPKHPQNSATHGRQQIGQHEATRDDTTHDYRSHKNLLFDWGKPHRGSIHRSVPTSFRYACVHEYTAKSFSWFRLSPWEFLRTNRAWKINYITNR